MKKLATLLLIGASFAISALPAIAADIIEPPVVITPEPTPVYEAAGGWYIRGDVDYALFKSRGVDYHAGGVVNNFTSANGGNAYSLGGGFGYQVSKHFRVDLTGDYEFGANFRGSTSGDCTVSQTEPGSCTSVDTAKYSVFELMANAYADLGNYHGFTPYVGAGIGGAYVNWGDLANVATCTSTGADCDMTHAGYTGNASSGSYTETHQGVGSMRFAWALMAGASYDISNNMKLDLGYRFKRIEGGQMFRYTTAANGTQGYDRGFDMHQVKVGLRYQFGGAASYSQASYAEPAVYK